MTIQTGPGPNLGDASLDYAPVQFENPVHANLARIAEEFASSNGELSPAEASLISEINDIVQPRTSAEACLAPVLALFGWAGEGRRIREALPHFDRINDVDALRHVLVLLGYRTTPRTVRLSEIPTDFLPCLFSSDDNEVMLIVERESDGKLLVFDGKTATWKMIAPTSERRRAYFVWDQAIKEEPPEQEASWLWSVIEQFGPVIFATLGLSFLGNIAALTLPIFVICVYDLGIGTKSTDTVVMLAVGAGLVIISNLILRNIRARAMAYFGARIDALISMKAFEVILNMPVGMIEAAPIGTQISRLKQFESMRESFTGTIATSLIDIPFICIFIAAIAFWGGHLVWVPLSLIGVYVLLSAISIPISRSYVRIISTARQRRVISSFRSIG